MGEASRADIDALAASYALDIAHTEAPIAVCSVSGLLLAATRSALTLLSRASDASAPARSVPPDLWRLLERSPAGEAVEWRAHGSPQQVLGCTRYASVPGTYVLLMRDVSAKRLAMAQRLQQQRMELTERLIASVAQDLRSSVASMVYSADFLNGTASSITSALRAETLRDISKPRFRSTRALRARVERLRQRDRVSAAWRGKNGMCRDNAPFPPIAA